MNVLANKWFYALYELFWPILEVYDYFGGSSHMHKPFKLLTGQIEKLPELRRSRA